MIELLAFLGAYIIMELVAWSAHKYLMHGPLWFLHRDHHDHSNRTWFERNDTFFLLFATPAIVCIIIGLVNGLTLPFWVGAGITAYGFSYFLVHDVFIHQRFRWFRNSDHWYFRAIRKAHKVHHKKMGREQGSCFGMLWVPMSFYRDAIRTRQR